MIALEKNIYSVVKIF